MTRAARASRAAIVAALTGAVYGNAAAASGPTLTLAPPAATAAAATWTRHALTLAYQGLTTQYSCEGLKQKMGALLRYFGARPESMQLRTYGCAGGSYRPSPAINLAMDFETLAPLPADGATTTVRGAWVERELFGKTRISRQAPSSIGRGDCELVEKFVATVLPSFSHEIVRNLTRCIPNDLNGMMPNLRVRVLVPESAQGHARRDFTLTLRAESRR